MIDKKIDVYLVDGSYQAVSVSWIHLDQPVAYQVGTYFGILNYKTNTLTPELSSSLQGNLNIYQHSLALIVQPST